MKAQKSTFSKRKFFQIVPNPPFRGDGQKYPYYKYLYLWKFQNTLKAFIYKALWVPCYNFPGMQEITQIKIISLRRKKEDGFSNNKMSELWRRNSVG